MENVSTGLVEAIFFSSKNQQSVGSQNGMWTEHVRKQAIELPTLADPDLRQGQGAEEAKVSPYKPNTPVWVRIRMHGYTMPGRMHCGQGQSVGDVFREDCTFPPLTEAIIASRKYVHGSRPFVAVNKSETISSAEIERPASAKQLMQIPDHGATGRTQSPQPAGFYLRNVNGFAKARLRLTAFVVNCRTIESLF